MTYPFEDEQCEEPRTLGSHFSARVRLILLGAVVWGVGFSVLAATGPKAFVLAPDSLLALVLALASGMIVTMIVIPMLPVFAANQKGGRDAKIDARAGLPVILVLTAVFFFFVTRRHEFFQGRPDELRLAADWLLAGGSLVGISSAVLGIVGIRIWRRVAILSLLIVGIGIVANSGLYVSFASSSLVRTDFWSKGLIRLFEGLTYGSWVVFCVSLLAWKRRRVRRIGFAAACLFALSTLALLLALLQGVLELSPPWDQSEQVIAPSFWSQLFGRLAWYYLLLYLVPLVAFGIRTMSSGREGIGRWFRQVLPVVPFLVVMGLLIQIWVTSYGAWMGRPWWPIWIPCVASSMMLMIWVKDRPLRNGRSSLATFAAVCLSILGVALWFWFRGPSLINGWSLHRGIAWRVIIRRILPLTLMVAVVSTCPYFFRSIRTAGSDSTRQAPRTKASRSSLFCWSMISLPSLVSGVLLAGLMLEMMHRVWSRYGTIFPFWSEFYASMLFFTVIAATGSIFAWRRLLAMGIEHSLLGSGFEAKSD